MTEQRDFIHDLQDEVFRAENLYPALHSLHEAYAVILEEVDELWDQARRKPHARIEQEIYMELVQIAAMAYRTARNLLQAL